MILQFAPILYYKYYEIIVMGDRQCQRPGLVQRAEDRLAFPFN